MSGLGAGIARAIAGEVWHELTMTEHVRITADGSVTLPADVRERLGVAEGDTLLIEETEDGVVLRSVAHAIAAAQALVRLRMTDRERASVDAFLAGRRADGGE